MNKRGCRFDVQRIVQCYTCPRKCGQFMNWYHDNKDWYIKQIEDHVNRFPDRYAKEYIMAETKTRKPAAPKMVAIMDGGTVEKIMPRDDVVKAKDADIYVGKRIIELTGKEYEVIVSIKLERKDLKESKPNTRSTKR